jgi:hypothetical protein
MKKIIIFLFIVCVSSAMAQTKINIFDDNLYVDKTVVIFERLDGSIFELNGLSNWTAHKVMPSSQLFSDFVKAKRPQIIEFETINGDQFSNTNGGNWKKTQRRYEPQGSMGVIASYKHQQKSLDVIFKLTSNTSVEVNLHSVYGERIFKLHNKFEQIGQHRLQLPVGNVPKGEYVLVVKTPQKVETVRLSISN